MTAFIIIAFRASVPVVEISKNSAPLDEYPG